MLPLRFLSFMVLLIFLSSCNNDVVEAPDVSHIDPDHQIIRFDERLMSIDTNNVVSELRNLQSDYPVFFDLYFKQVLPLRGANIEELGTSLRGFLQVEQIKTLTESIQDEFSDISDIEHDINQAYKYYQYYFPDNNIPDVYMLFSEYAYQSFIFSNGDKDGVGIGLDLFLGKDYPYDNINPKDPTFSDYLTRSYNRDHIVKKIMEVILQDQLGEVAKHQLLDQMILNGKKLYALDKILPYKSDTLIMEFSKEDWDWVNENELEMFAFFLNEELFYESDLMKINKYITASPDSPGMPPAAPGRTANFIGWKIVDAFMDKHPAYTIPDLFAERDAQKIMNESRYKPRRKD